MAEKPALKRMALWGCRLIVGGTFAYAAGAKIYDPQAFATSIARYHLLSRHMALIVAYYLPWLELVCGLALLTRWREKGALLLIGTLCAVFASVLLSAWWRGLDIDCGCFGESSHSWVPIALARIACLGTLTGILLKGLKSPPSPLTAQI